MNPELMIRRLTWVRRKKRPPQHRRALFLPALYRVRPETLTGEFAITASLYITNDSLANGFYRR